MKVGKKIQKKKIINLKKSSSKTEKQNLPRLDNRKLVFFIIKFFLIFFVLSYILEVLPLAWLNEFIAQVSALVVGLPVSGAQVYVYGAVFIVGNACTGLMSASILAAIIFSLNKPNLIKKITLFLIGLGILLVVNIPRVMLVLLSAKAGLDANLIHELTWFMMSGVILIIWYYGTKKMCGINDFSELI